MSYERDKDKHTRGVGAIAALDHGNAARRRFRDVRRRRTDALDRQLAAYTYRPGGGISAPHEGLGRINLGATKAVINTAKSRATLTTRNPLPSGTTTGGQGGQQPSRLYGGAGSMLQTVPNVSFQTATKTGGGTISSGATMRPTAGTVRPSGGLVFPGGTVTPANQSGPIVEPIPPGAITSIPTDTATASSGGGYTGGGGGGGAGYGYGGKPPAFPGMETPEVPDIPAELEVTSSGPDIKTVALVGGAAVAVWYFFFRKKGAAQP